MNLQATDYGSYTSPDDPGEPTTGVRRISVTDQEGALLACLARGHSVVEFGTGLAVSTRALASTARWVFTLDPDPWVDINVWPTLPNNCVVARPQYGPRVRHWDMAFIDADHATAAVQADIQRAESLVVDGGMIVVHDAKMDEVRAALDDTWIHVDTHHGLAIKIV